MGSVELLSREGEIAIAKRIEAGREMMIGGICESPLTIRAIIDWHSALKDGKLLLRDIIDLDATYGAGPDGAGEVVAANENDDEGEEQEEREDAHDGPRERPEGEDGEGEEEDNGISLSAMEEALKPQVLETFDRLEQTRSEEHTSELQSLMRISSAVFCLKK